jgi:TRAP-type C4-dicarboxylate transport system substrate-binding protein
MEEVPMVKKSCFVFMAVWIGLALIASATLKAHAQTINLTYSDSFPSAHSQSMLNRAWCKEVEARTKGRVKIQYFPGGSLTKPTECYDAVVKGASDICHSAFSYNPGRFPLMDTAGLPLGYTSGKVATAVVNELYRHYKPAELSETVVMYVHAHGPGFFHTKGKAVRRLEDMSGLRIQCQGVSELITKQLGSVPVFGTMNETYDMLRKGTVVGANYPFESNASLRLGEQCDYVTAAYSVSYCLPMYVVMNKNKWNALPNDIKNTIMEINNEWVPQHGEAWDAFDRLGMLFFLSHGGRIIGLDMQEAARWKIAVYPIIDNYVKFLYRNKLNGLEIIDFTMNTLNSMIRQESKL